MSDIEKMLGLRKQFSHFPAYKVSRWATEEEGQLIYNIIQNNSVKQYVEVGTANGWTAAWAALAGVNVFTHDIVTRPKIYLHEAFPFKALVDKIKFREVGSPICFESPNWPVLTPTLYFIDGDHQTTPVKNDWEGCKKKLNPGDIVLFHDTKNHRSVSSVIAREIKPLSNVKITEYDTYNGITRIDWM